VAVFFWMQGPREQATREQGNEKTGPRGGGIVTGGTFGNWNQAGENFEAS